MLQYVDVYVFKIYVRNNCFGMKKRIGGVLINLLEKPIRRFGSFSLPLYQEGQLSITGESVCTKYWLTA